MDSQQNPSSFVAQELFGKTAIWDSNWMSSLWQKLLTGDDSGLEGIGFWEDLFVSELMIASETQSGSNSQSENSDSSSAVDSDNSLLNGGENAHSTRDWLTGQLQQTDWAQVLASLRNYGDSQGHSTAEVNQVEAALFAQVQDLPSGDNHDCALPFAVVAEGSVTVNGSSDFDGDPLDPTDDVLIYGGQGFTLNGRPILPVQRDDDGNPITDDQGRPVLVDNAVAVSANYTTLNAPQNQYAGLVPPQVVEEQRVEVPSHSDVVAQALASEIPAAAQIIDFNPNSRPINNRQDWEQYFPAGGTTDQPTVVRLSGWGLNIPNGVSLENMILIAERGSINFNGSGHQLNNVTLIAENGGINLSNVEATDVTVLASQHINMNGGAQFGGNSLLASEQSVTFNGATTSGADRLKVISQRDITFNGRSDTRAQFLSGGNFTFNSRSSLYGRISAKGNVIFNGQATVFAANDAPIVGANRVLSVEEDSAATPLNIQLPVDLDEDVLSLRVTGIPDYAKGSVQLADGSAVITGQRLTLAELQGLTFVPVENANGDAGQFSYEADDGWCSYSRQVIDLQISPVNDAPNLLVPTEISSIEAGQPLAISGVSISDIDAGSGELAVTLSAANGIVKLGNRAGLTVLDGDATAGSTALTVSGTLTALNASLSTLTYTGDSGFEGVDTLTLTVDDQGNTGSGGPLTQTATVALEVTASGLLLEEGTNFQVVAEEALTIPETPAVIRFTYTDFFDTSDSNAINDAFEVALLDGEGSYNRKWCTRRQ